jgi:hypothetical protein
MPIGLNKSQCLLSYSDLDLNFKLNLQGTSSPVTSSIIVQQRILMEYNAI